MSTMKASSTCPTSGASRFARFGCSTSYRKATQLSALEEIRMLWFLQDKISLSYVDMYDRVNSQAVGLLKSFAKVLSFVE